MMGLAWGRPRVNYSQSKAKGLLCERWDRAAWTKCPLIGLLANREAAGGVGLVGSGGLTRSALRSCFVLMEFETLGIARSLGWKVHMRCAQGYREGMKSMRWCVYRKQLDLDTVVCTRAAELSALAPGVSADVPGVRKPLHNGRVRTAKQQSTP